MESMVKSSSHCGIQLWRFQISPPQSHPFSIHPPMAHRSQLEMEPKDDEAHCKLPETGPVIGFFTPGQFQVQPVVSSQPGNQWKCPSGGIINGDPLPSWSKDKGINSCDPAL
jgi:hypothetical protein